MSDTVTVGLAARDAGAYLRPALLSLINQTHKNWRLILVDDGSVDGAAEACADVLDGRCTYVRHKTSVGLAESLNEIARLTTTEILFRFDADDVMATNRLEVIAQFLQQRVDVDVVGTRAYVIDEAANLLGLYRERVDIGDAARALKETPVAHPTIAGRTAWFQKHPYTSEYARAEDKELWLRTLPYSKFSKLGSRLYFYRINAVSGNLRYFEKCANDRALARRYGPELVGATATRRIVAGSYVKQAIYAAASRQATSGRRLQMRRVEPLPEAEADKATEELLRASQSAPSAGGA
jgi:glycosyltransferase involved in cell wall biosynthesis